MSVRSVKKKVKSFFNENNIKNLKVLLAISGGKDSRVLLDVCDSLKNEFNLTFKIAHFDHNLRESSKKDANFVKKLSKEYGFEFFTKIAPKKPKQENTESWARRNRYDFLKEILTKQKLDYIFTAHTASDSSETLLMRLVSNKDLKGIYRIDERRSLVRPMLSVLRKEIDEYIDEKDLKFVQDPTNFDTNYLRNKIRHKLIPFLKDNFNENIESFLSNRSNALQEDFFDLYDIANKKLSLLKDKKKYSKAWVKKLNDILIKAPLSIRWRMAELILKEELNYNVGRKVSCELLDLFFLKRLAVNLPDNKRIFHKRGAIFIEDIADK